MHIALLLKFLQKCNLLVILHKALLPSKSFEYTNFNKILKCIPFSLLLAKYMHFQEVLSMIKIITINFTIKPLLCFFYISITQTSHNLHWHGRHLSEHSINVKVIWQRKENYSLKNRLISKLCLFLALNIN